MENARLEKKDLQGPGGGGTIIIILMTSTIPSGKNKLTLSELFLCPVPYTPYFIMSSRSPYEVGLAIPISQMQRMNQDIRDCASHYAAFNGWGMIQTWVFLTSASELVSPHHFQPQNSVSPGMGGGKATLKSMEDRGYF